MTVPLSGNVNERTRHDRLLELFLKDSYNLHVVSLCFWKCLSDKNPEQHIPIVAPLFGALDRLIAVESDTRTTLNYPKQMVLSCLISIVKGLQVWISVSLLTIEHSAFRFKYVSGGFSDCLHQDLDESSSA